MDKSKEIPGFLPEDYDKEPPGIENENVELDEQQEQWLHHEQVADEDGPAFGQQIASEYDSYIVIGFKKEKRQEDGSVEHELVTGAYHVDSGDYDAVYEMARLLGEYAAQDIEVYKILKKALSRHKSIRNEEDNPEPPAHNYLLREHRFHLNRYNRILSEEFEKVSDEFRYALGDYDLRRDMRMHMVLTAVADQLTDNEPVEIDFFCNFVLGEESHGDNVSGIDVRELPYPCTWEEAANKRDRFVALCKRYDVPCHIEWLQD